MATENSSAATMHKAEDHQEDRKESIRLGSWKVQLLCLTAILPSLVDRFTLEGFSVWRLGLLTLIDCLYILATCSVHFTALPFAFACCFPHTEELHS